MKHLKLGDRVKYSRNFLCSAGMFTGDLPFVKGEITALTDFGSGKLATISWDLPGIPDKVLSSNLVKIGEVELA